MAAGSLQTPKVLELSGIGPSDILQMNNISTILDLPGVGNNLQDHYLVGTYYQYYNQSYTYSNQLNLDPNNDTLNVLAEQEYYANRTGPWTAGPADGNAFPSLAQISNRSADFIANASNQSAQTYLLAGLDPTVVAGYTAQLTRLIAALADPTRAVIELLNSNAGNISPSIMRPFSRGSSHINSSNPFDPPRIDPRYGSNPIDTDILLESLLFNRLLLATAPMSQLDPFQWAPPADADEAALRIFINNAIGTEYHPSGTAAMLPLSLGGVVDPNLLVYGTQNLRVVDASICPTIPASHMQAVVYAIAEKVGSVQSANPAVFAALTALSSLGLRHHSRCQHKHKPACSKSSRKRSLCQCNFLHKLQRANLYWQFARVAWPQFSFNPCEHLAIHNRRLASIPKCCTRLINN